MNRLFKPLSALVLLLFFTPLTQAEERLFLTTGLVAPLVTPDRQGALDTLYRKLGQQLDYDIQIQLVPSARALLNADAGIDDGVPCRVAGLEKMYPHLIQVPEEVFQLNMHVFSTLPHLKINGIKSLKPYRVGFMRGWKLLEQNIVDSKEITLFSSIEEMFNALKKDVIDIAITEKYQGLATIEKTSGIRLLEPALLQNSCYAYLNEKHSALVPKLSAALKKMKADGSYQHIFNGMVKP